MEIEKVREHLLKVALDHSHQKPDEAIQSIALALLHMAEGIADLEAQTRGISQRLKDLESLATFPRQ